MGENSSLVDGVENIEKKKTTGGAKRCVADEDDKENCNDEKEKENVNVDENWPDMVNPRGLKTSISVLNKLINSELQVRKFIIKQNKMTSTYK